MTARIRREDAVLNGICPYFTMFPLEFPLGILQKKARKGDVVLDPFCGRGTTNFAARLVGLYSVGIDSSPVATAITAAKLVTVSPDEIITEARRILAEFKPRRVPIGEFWEWAYHPAVLEAICRLRDALLEECTTAARIALRGIVLGALHGPRQKTLQSYFSNQCPRTYAPKPAYAIRFWKERGLKPEFVDVLSVIERRARRYYKNRLKITGEARLADSRKAISFQPDPPDKRFNWVITSPPYYGMRTYLPDQWIRNWFVGGPDTVDYSTQGQLVHSSPEDFALDLRKVWRNVHRVCADRANMVIRFGSIADKHIDAIAIIKYSLEDTGWEITAVESAGTATNGKRQADTFLRRKSNPLLEFDIWARRK